MRKQAERHMAERLYFGIMRAAGRRTVASIVLALAPAIAAGQVGMGRLSGYVKDERGRPLKGATITAESGAVAPGSLTAATDAKGRFTLIGLRKATWKVRVEAEGFHPITLDVPVQTVAPNRPLDVRLVRLPEPGPPPLLRGADPRGLQRELDEASALVASGQTDDALAAYRRVLERHPALTSIHLQLGYLLEIKGDRAAALDEYRAALKGDPSSEPARAAVERLKK
jgi:tetratricopeptide (TPR) repeat protein